MTSVLAAVSAREISARTASVSCWRSAVTVSTSSPIVTRCVSPMRSPIASAFSSSRLASVRSPRSQSAQPRKYRA